MLFLLHLFFFNFFGDTPGMQKFLGQGSNQCHKHDPDHTSDNTGSWLSHQRTPITSLEWKCVVLKNRNRLTDIENRFVIAKGEKGGGGMDWKFEG